MKPLFRLPDISELRTPEENERAKKLDELMQKACDEMIATFRENENCLVYKFVKESGAKAKDMVICKDQMGSRYWVELKSEQHKSIATPDEISQRDDLILVMSEILSEAKKEIKSKRLLAKINLVLDALEPDDE